MMSFWLFMGVLLGTAARSNAQLARIGAAAAVHGRVMALAPTQGAVGRVMESGKEVYLRDAVTTDAKGRMQIMLLDETVFTVGPNSSLVLDEFVYDPNTGAGRMTARVTKGVFRFVTGKIARETPSNMKVKLPVGVIGIRGTIALGKVYSPTSAFVMLAGPGPRNNANEKPGALNVSGAGRAVDIKRTGMGSDMDALKGPSDPYVVPQAKVNEVTSDLGPSSNEPSQGSGGGSGGGGGSAAKSDDSSVTDDSGQGTAGALGDLSTTESVSEVTQDNTQLTDAASQTVLRDSGAQDNWRYATWDEMRGSSLGTGYYQFSGSRNCSGTYCGASGAATYTARVDVSFQSRAITGVNFVVTWPNGGGTSSTGLSSSIPFGSGSGEARIANMTGYVTNSGFQYTHMQFQSVNGVAGARADIGMHATNGSDSLGNCYNENHESDFHSN
ncbi:MAG: FecR domain-containing protein [Elusimicrobia bacterium]|nr:FecR domain-containing protein [Elusimicrobiota bacterium]